MPVSLAITYEDIVTSICASICAREVVHSQLGLALAFVLDSDQTLPIIVIQFYFIYKYKFLQSGHLGRDGIGRVPEVSELDAGGRI